MDGKEKREDKQAELLLARLSDLVRRAERDCCCLATRFLDPSERQMAERHLRKIAGGLSISANGGYPGAERAVLLLCPDYLSVETEIRREPVLAALRLSWATQYYSLTHRDLLGAVLGLGLKRDQIGDILVEAGLAQMIVLAGSAEFIARELRAAGRAPLKVEILDLPGIIPPVPRIKEIRATVASPRLDALLAAAFGLSRAKAVPLIEAERVQIDHRPALDPAAPVPVGAVLSVRGLGRARLAALPGRTKKGRWQAVLERFV